MWGLSKLTALCSRLVRGLKSSGSVQTPQVSPGNSSVLCPPPAPPAKNIRVIPAQAGDPLLGQPGSPSCHSSFLV